MTILRGKSWSLYVIDYFLKSIMSSSSSKGSSNRSNYPSRSLTTSSLEGLVTSPILMVVPVSSHPEDEAILTYPKEPTKYKEHVIIETIREFEVMLVYNVRAP